MNFIIENLTKEELQQKVDSGEYKMDTIWNGDYVIENLNQPLKLLKKNINKYKYFKIDILCGYKTGEDYDNVQYGYQYFRNETVFTRDYINKWIVNNTYTTPYSVEGNFGDGTEICITNFEKSPDTKYTRYLLVNVYGYRPTRKTIYVYKKDGNTYLVTSDNDYLYTANDLRLVTSDIAE